MEDVINLLMFQKVYGLDRQQEIVVSVLMWAVIIPSVYFILYPIIWERKFIEYKLKAKVVDKYHKSETNVQYNAATKTTTTSTSHYWNIVFEIEDKPSFLPKKRIKKNFGESVFDDTDTGSNVTLLIKEKRRRFRFGTSAELKYYGYDFVSFESND